MTRPPGSTKDASGHQTPGTWSCALYEGLHILCPIEGALSLLLRRAPPVFCQVACKDVLRFSAVADLHSLHIWTGSYDSFRKASRISLHAKDWSAKHCPQIDSVLLKDICEAEACYIGLVNLVHPAMLERVTLS